MKASSAPATTPGAISGSVTCRNVCQPVAPRSCAASSIAGSMPDEARAHDDRDERDLERDVREDHRRHAELEEPEPARARSAKKSSIATAMTMSGITTGMYISHEKSFLPGKS